MPPVDESFERLLEHLKETRSFDFTGYKRPSLVRRVQHAMNRLGISSFDEYLDHLQVHPGEFTVLFNTILINVTSFYRDPDAWEHLRSEVVPRVIAAADTGPIRLWSAGCASGQEAYTLAMCLAEELGEQTYLERVKVYATDVDDDALATARAATYSLREMEGLPDHLADRYFETSGTRSTFRKDLRRTVIFGRNDLNRDAPISRVHLIACRNTLMYFNREAQDHLLRRLHFALRDDGVLFLGKAETLLSHPGLFHALDLRYRLFEKRGDAPLQERTRLTVADPVLTKPSTRPGLDDASLRASPLAQITLSPSGTLVLANERARALLGLDDRDLGRVFSDLQIAYRPVDLRPALDQAVSQRRPVFVRDVDWGRYAGEHLPLEIEVIPLLSPSGTLSGLTLAFTDLTRYQRLQEQLTVSHRQLQTAHEELQSTNEELETTNEELQSTVEELETTNEELQSTNEELETMNEELQSINDELQVANEDLREKTGQIDSLNQFMQTILTSLSGGVVVLDRELTVLVWNQRAEDLWGVRQDEVVGSALSALDIGLPLAPVVSAAHEVVVHGRRTDLTLDAVNRRGRSISVRLTLNPLEPVDQQPSAGVLVVMDQVSADD